MPTPNLYSKVRQPLFEELATELEDLHIEFVYVTDCSPQEDGTGRLNPHSVA